MKKTYKKVLTVATVAAMMTTMAAPAFAANGDFYDNSTNTPYNALSYQTNATVFNAMIMGLILHPDTFVFENNNQEYNYSKMLTAITTKMTAGETVAQAFTEAKADPANVDVKGTTTPAAVTVASVSAINATTVQVVLGSAPATDLTNTDASKFEVKVNGTVVAAPTAVTKVASDLTGKTYKLTVATLNGQQGDIAVNGITAPVATGMTYAFDYQAPTLQSVTAKGTTTLELQFNEKLDSAGTNIATSNFKVSAVVGGVADTVNTAVLDSTGTKVTLTLAAPLTVADYVVTLGNPTGPVNVNDVAGNGIYNGTQITFRPTTTQLTVQDAPSLTKAIYDRVSGKLSLTFSKNITTMDATKLSINGVALTGNDTVVNANNVSTITMSSTTKTALNALTGALTLTSAKDAYGDANLTTGETFLVSLEQPAVISSVAYDQQSNKLTVTFDQPVTLTADTVLTVGDNVATNVSILKSFAVNADGTAADTTVANSSWTFDATTVAPAIETGMTIANLKASILPDAVTNGAIVNNVAGQDTYTKGVKVAYTADTTNPTLASVEYNNNTQNLVLTFNEKIDVNTANTYAANVKLWMANGTALTNFTSLSGLTALETAGTTSKTLTYNLSGVSADETALELAFNTGKTVKATIDGTVVKDEANLMGVATTYATGTSVAYKDYHAATLTGGVLVTNKNLISVKFSEPVDAATSANSNNYVITDTTGAKLAITNVSVLAVDNLGTVTVLLTTADQIANSPYTLKVNNVKDLAGNIMAPATGTFNGSSVSDVSALTVDTLAVAAPVNSKNDTLTVGFNAAPDSAKALNLNNYVVLQADADTTTGWTNATQVSLTNATAAFVSGTPTQVKITLDSANLKDGKYYKVVASNVTTVTGKALGTSTGDADAVTSVALVADPLPTPTMTANQTAAGAIKLVFNQELDSAAATLATNYTATNNGTAVAVTKATYSWNAATSKATVVLDLASAPAAPVAVTLNANIKNLAGVSVAGSPLPATVLTDNVAPSVDTVVAIANPNALNDAITVTFADKDILGASVTASDIVLQDASGNVIPAADYTVAPSIGSSPSGADQAIITFGESSPNNYNLQNGQNYAVTISGVVDTSGNSIATTTKTAAWDLSTDVLAPGIVSQTVSQGAAGTGTVAVQFSEDVDVATATNKANYVVKSSTDGATWSTTLTPTLVTYDASTKTATVYFAQTLDPLNNQYQVTVKNVKDLAGNVQTTGSTL